MSRTIISALGAIALAILIFGCVSQNGPAAFNQTPNAAAQAPAAPGIKQMGVNETFTSDNISFVITSWGFAPVWGDSSPQNGAKYLWVYARTTNVGKIPIEHMPSDFKLLYRGINASGKEKAYKGYVLPINSAWGVIYEKENYFPNTSDEGYIHFEVPQDLADNEASILATIGSSQVQVNLANPVAYNGTHLLVENASFSCTYGNELNACNLAVTVLNDRNAPIGFSNTVPLSPSINSIALGANPQQSYLAATVKNLNPFDETTFVTPFWIGVKKNEKDPTNSQYVGFANGGLPTSGLGKPGQVVGIKICDACSPDSFEVALPTPPPGFFK